MPENSPRAYYDILWHSLYDYRPEEHMPLLKVRYEDVGPLLEGRPVQVMLADDPEVDE